VERVDYQASGGQSRLFGLDGGEQFLVEAHSDSFTLLWSTPLSVALWLDEMRPILPDRDGRVLVVTDGHADPKPFRSEDWIRTIAAKGDAVDFVRIRFPDRMVSWEGRPEDDGVGGYHEAALLATRLDFEYLAECVRKTGSRDVRARSLELIRESVELLARFPVASLYPTGGDATPPGALTRFARRGAARVAKRIRRGPPTTGVGA
jgi:hypothetical protein